ncbi:MAG TPA: YciI family protein [Geminicoccaceae bacterium]|nr:YciI family protein [Geminicoccaceae bacterium]
MPYVIITRDKPNSLALRNEVRAVHVDYLTANQHRLLAAGAMIEDDGRGGSGGVIIIDTDDRKEAEDFIANDPFTKAGLFEDVQVKRWRKAFFNYERLV